MSPKALADAGHAGWRRSAGRKLHPCGWLCSQAQPSGVADVTGYMLARPRPARPSPNLSVTSPSSIPAVAPPLPRPHAAHAGKHQENIRSLFWLLDESQLQPGIFGGVSVYKIT